MRERGRRGNCETWFAKQKKNNTSNSDKVWKTNIFASTCHTRERWERVRALTANLRYFIGNQKHPLTRHRISQVIYCHVCDSSRCAFRYADGWMINCYVITKLRWHTAWITISQRATDGRSREFFCTANSLSPVDWWIDFHVDNWHRFHLRRIIISFRFACALDKAARRVEFHSMCSSSACSSDKSCRWRWWRLFDIWRRTWARWWRCEMSRRLINHSEISCVAPQLI